MSTSPYRLGFTWANPFSANLGVSALAYSAVEIASRALDRRPIEPWFFTGTESKTRTLELPCGSFEARLRPMVNFARPKAWLRLLRPGSSPRCLLGMKTILDIGEGDSFSDIYGSMRFHALCSTKIVLGLTGRSQALMPQTIGPFATRRAERLAAFAMRRMNFLSARDAMSFDTAQKLVPERNCSEYVDMAFALPYSHNPGFGPGVHVGLNVSGLLMNGGYTGDNQFGLACPYPELVEGIAKRILAESDTVLHLVPHVFGTGCEPSEEDRSVSEILCRELSSDRVKVAPSFPDPCAAKTYISGLDFFMGARMHSCIAAFSSRVPVLPMAYSRKFNGLFQKTLGYEPLLDLKVDGLEDGIEHALRMFSARGSLKESIERSMDGVVAQRIDRLTSDLKGILSA